MTASGSLEYSANTVPPRTTRRPRLWVGAVIILLMWIVIKGAELAFWQTMIHFMAMMWGPIIGFVAVSIWWLAFSRLAWSVRIAGFAAFVLGVVGAFVWGDPSIKFGLIVFALPLALTAWVLAAIVFSFLGTPALRTGVIIVPLLVWGYFSLVRLDGLTGSIHAALSWRWAPTAEDLYLARKAQLPKKAALTTGPATSTPLELSAGDWPGFRGPHRDGVLTGATIATDWVKNPPRRLWRHGVGPGWSSFCVVGDRAFTQEQRGPVEVVSCYSLSTGDELWAHEDQTRFSESMAGPGPRATPTFAGGWLYTQGASGKLNCLDPLTGRPLWTRDIAADSGAAVPMWGFAASPLVYHDLVTVITGAKGKSVMAYQALTGNIAWSAGEGYSYASTQLSRLAGVDQLLLTTQAGLTSLDPLTGQQLWSHSFPIGNANRCTQPMILNDNELLLGVAFGIGTRRIKITHDNGLWKDETIWTSPKLKPYYNDAVLHDGYVYGFDGDVFVCFDPATKQFRWRSHEYGNGQVLLIADQNLLLILSETGQAALVDAKPEEYHELAKFQALNGKTWNHPVIAHGKLLIRNGEEAACYSVE